jgi:hypothetical protein
VSLPTSGAAAPAPKDAQARLDVIAGNTTSDAGCATKPTRS